MRQNANRQIRIHKLAVFLSLSLLGRQAMAQGTNGQGSLTAPCLTFNRQILDDLSHNRLQDAESALSRKLSEYPTSLGRSCDWLILGNRAVVAARLGQLDRAENYAARAVGIAEKLCNSDDPMLLRPLATLGSVRFEQNKIAGALQVFERMRLIRTESPADLAFIHNAAGALLLTQGRNQEAEAEYLLSIASYEQSGYGETADTAGVLIMLARAYMSDRRFPEALRALDRAGTALDSASDAVPMDRIKLLNTRAAVHGDMGRWPDACEDLAAAVSLADSASGNSAIQQSGLLANYALVLRKNRRSREARQIESRASELNATSLGNALVDKSELLAKTNTVGK